MTQAEAPETPSQTKGKGKAFFDRADQVADTGNWDFAIEMYIEGIKREPEELERGHAPLRETSLKRKAQGGKGPGLKDQIKRRPGKDPLTNLANAEYMLAKEPGSVQYMQQVLKAATTLELDNVCKWLADILLEAMRQAKKPNKGILVQLTQVYDKLAEYAQGVQACELALKVAPNDGSLHEIARDLSAKYTIKKGKYDQEGDFTKGVKDMEEQQKLVQADAMVQDEKYLAQEVERARQEYIESPTVPGKINGLADALLKFEEEAYENEAIDVLAKAHRDTGAFAYKMRIGDIRVKQMHRRYRKLVAAGEKEEALKQARRQLDFELDEYAERAANYPTDLAIKYELGVRQYLAGKLDEAIGSLQQASRDPRRHVRAMSYLGQAFSKKGLLLEAIDTFERTLRAEMPEERQKEVRYLLGDALERHGKLAEAREQFSDVAQLDYSFKDVRKRLDAISRKMQEAEGA